MNYSPQGSSVHGISQARILEWVAISFSMGSSRPRDQTGVSRIAGGFFINNSWCPGRNENAESLVQKSLRIPRQWQRSFKSITGPFWAWLCNTVCTPWSRPCVGPVSHHLLLCSLSEKSPETWNQGGYSEPFHLNHWMFWRGAAGRKGNRETSFRGITHQRKGCLGILSCQIPFLFLFFLATLHSMWDLSSATGDWTCTPTEEARSLLSG